MITIRPVYEKHKMLFSNPGSGERGFSVMAKSIDEVHAAIDHYQVRPHNHLHCPLCRLETKERVKSNRKRKHA